jgi:peptidoglycan hydrolase-like protein with peptidoglycan-binding domain
MVSVRSIDDNQYLPLRLPTSQVDLGRAPYLGACTTPAPFSGILGEGSTDVQVRPLQLLLRCLGHFPAGVEANGVFGPTTETALRAFQSANGIAVVGFTSSETLAALNRYVAAGSVTLPPAPTPVQTSCTIPDGVTTLLTLNATSTQVRTLQTLLKCLGHFPADQATTAIYGSVTQAAVRAFQAATGVPVTGVTDPLTREQINRYVVSAVVPVGAGEPEPEPTPAPAAPACSTDTTFSATIGPGSTDAVVLPLQELLQCLGHFPATVTPNGIYGPTTEASVRAFQRAKGIAETGTLGPATRTALNAY